MSLWFWILLACAVAWLTKFCGYLVPARWLASARISQVANTLTVGLLASLTAMNTVAAGDGAVLDARLVALLAAALALSCRASFVLVVLAGALSTALLRAVGWG